MRVTIKAVPTKQRSRYEFDLTAGHLSLNLANTISRRDDPQRRDEHLETYTDLLAFARQSGMLASKHLTELTSWAQRHEREVRHSFHRSVILREALYRAFSAIAQNKAAADSALHTINGLAVQALQHRVLRRKDGGYRWEWQLDGKGSLDYILWQVAESAASLLTSEELKSVRLCEAPDCDWLFLDHSRNRSRRWCDMNSCGNRQKARRHYLRLHE